MATDSSTITTITVGSLRPQKEENDSWAKDRICLQTKDDTQAQPDRWKQGPWLEQDMGRGLPENTQTQLLLQISAAASSTGKDTSDTITEAELLSHYWMPTNTLHLRLEKQKARSGTWPLERRLTWVLMLWVHIFSLWHRHFSGVLMHFEQLQALNKRTNLFTEPMGMYACWC